MKTKKEILKIIIDNLYDKESNILDLSGLDFKDMEINLSKIKANMIWNKWQEANNIYNSHQQAKEKIYNNYQKANEIINNNNQIAASIDNEKQKADNIYNDLQEAKDNIFNENQKGKNILNTYQRKLKMTNKQKLELLIEHFYNKEKNILDLSKLDCKDISIDLSHIKANCIWNDHQIAKYGIINGKQQAGYILNDTQEANTIYNDYQIGNEIWNTYQKAKNIRNHDQRETNKETNNEN